MGTEAGPGLAGRAPEINHIGPWPSAAAESELKIEASPASMPRQKQAPRKTKPVVEPEIHRRPAPGAKKSFPWLALASTVLGLTFAALGFWFIEAIY